MCLDESFSVQYASMHILILLTYCLLTRALNGSFFPDCHTPAARNMFS